MALIRQYHKDTDTTYVYESISYWDVSCKFFWKKLQAFLENVASPFWRKLQPHGVAGATPWKQTFFVKSY